jgi:hypothetical protein
MTQTALEWFVNGLQECNYIPKDRIVMNDFIKKAKKIEKEQIMKAFSKGKINHNKDLAIEYYNKTYNK